MVAELGLGAKCLCRCEWQASSLRLECQPQNSYVGARPGLGVEASCPPVSSVSQMVNSDVLTPAARPPSAPAPLPPPPRVCHQSQLWNDGLRTGCGRAARRGGTGSNPVSFLQRLTSRFLFEHQQVLVLTSTASSSFLVPQSSSSTWVAEWTPPHLPVPPIRPLASTTGGCFSTG